MVYISQNLIYPQRNSLRFQIITYPFSRKYTSDIICKKQK